MLKVLKTKKLLKRKVGIKAPTLETILLNLEWKTLLD